MSKRFSTHCEVEILLINKFKLQEAGNIHIRLRCTQLSA